VGNVENNNIVNRPRLSIGLPVFNGELLIRDALDSILGQTFTDFELIISDNGSHDRTEEICRSCAAKDSRIRYLRNDVNKGVVWNFNRVFEIATGEYFKWVTHDDVYRPTFLERCIEYLDQNPDTVMVYTKTTDIDINGLVIEDRHWDLRENSPFPWERFRHLICNEHSCFQIFAVIRSQALRKTQLHGSYYGSDRVLLAELSLLGPFYEVPEDLFLHREYSGRVTKTYDTPQLMYKLYKPDAGKQRSFPFCKLFREYFSVVSGSSLGLHDKLRCCFQLLRWIRWHHRDLIRDLTYNLKH